MLEVCLRQVLAADVQSVVVAAPPNGVAEVDAVVQSILTGPRQASVVVHVVPGAATRQASVAVALQAVPADAGIVLVHDAARPLTPSTQFDAVAASVAATGGAAVPALQPADTVKSVDGRGVVERTLDRARLAAVQTPQGFPFDALVRAYERADGEYTDDAALFAADGGSVVVVPGDPAAFKITTRWDLARAEDLLRPAGADLRTGLGVDVHAFDQAAALQLGGLSWPGPGLAGHSDGDAVCHAVADALLSAAGLGDVGGVFGVDQPQEAGRPGLDFIRRVVRLLAEGGATPINVAVQIIAVAPRIATRRDEMQQVLSQAVGAPVSVSGTTTDGLGFAGRGEGLTAIASALVAVA